VRRREEEESVNDELAFIEVIAVKTETAKAILCVFADQSEHWIPKSVIDDGSEVINAEHARGTLVVPDWFAAKEGWDDV
jgi:hypothetical protein